MTKLNRDGSMENETFSGDKYTFGYPHTNIDGETYGEYFKRVQKYKDNGFHLGDLSWRDWDIYCKGSPYHNQYLQDEEY